MHWKHLKFLHKDSNREGLICIVSAYHVCRFPFSLGLSTSSLYVMNSLSKLDQMKTLNLHLHHFLRNATTCNSLDWTNNIREQLCVCGKVMKSVSSRFLMISACARVTYPILSRSLVVSAFFANSGHQNMVKDLNLLYQMNSEALDTSWHILTHLDTIQSYAMLCSLLVMLCLSLLVAFLCFSHVSHIFSLGLLAAFLD